MENLSPLIAIPQLWKAGKLPWVDYCKSCVRNIFVYRRNLLHYRPVWLLNHSQFDATIAGLYMIVLVRYLVPFVQCYCRKGLPL